MGCVRHDRFHRHIVGEHFAGSIGNQTALGVNRLLVDMFLRGQTGVLVVLNQLEINESKGKRAKERDKTNADQRAPSPSVPSHLPIRSVATGRMASSSVAGRMGASRTMLCSVIGTIFR